jgi:PhzF family phenazine biosynthesis protein
MSSSVRVFQVDAFTAQRFCGNPAGVVLDADALSDQQMQQLARELNNSDTAFLFEPQDADHDLRVRFFTPLREVAFVGHATLAAHAVLAVLGLAARPRQRQRSGIVEIDCVSGAWPPRIAIHLPPPALQRQLTAAELSGVLDALSLTPADLDPRCPAQIAGENSTRLLLGLTRGERLARLQPDMPRLATLSAEIGAPGYFLFSRQPSVPDVFTEARMFAPALGIAEDPVSGNAHALLGSYLLQHGLLELTQGSSDGASTIEFSGAQGHHLGRPGRVSVVLNLERELLQSISIVGEAVVVFGTTLEF